MLCEGGGSVVKFVCGKEGAANSHVACPYLARSSEEGEEGGVGVRV